MILDTVNPYSTIGTQFTDGLDAVALAFKASAPTMDDFADEIETFVGDLYYGAGRSLFVQVELKSMLGYALNGYSNSIINTEAGGYSVNSVQNYFVKRMLYSILHMPINEIEDAILDIEDNITRTRGLSTEEKVPLLLATQVGQQSIAYWLPKITTPGDWNIYMDSNDSINTANIPYWVSASMEGALLLANRSKNYGLVEGNSNPDPNVDIASALSGAIAACSGKIMFRIIKRITSEGKSFNVSGCNC